MQLGAPACAAPSPLRVGSGNGSGAGAAGGGVDALERLGPLESLGLLAPADVHILVVDDERLTRLVVANLLRKCAYKGTQRRGSPALCH
jgi:hypothetical protein